MGDKWIISDLKNVADVDSLLIFIEEYNLPEENDVQEYKVNLINFKEENLEGINSIQELAYNIWVELERKWKGKRWRVICHCWGSWIMYELLGLIKNSNNVLPYFLIISSFPSISLPIVNVQWSKVEGCSKYWDLMVNYEMKHRNCFGYISTLLIFSNFESKIPLRQDMMDKWQEIFPNTNYKLIYSGEDGLLKTHLLKLMFDYYEKLQPDCCGFLWYDFDDYLGNV
tara:strand:- start:3526 stop:4206 length:681 start_codon:yes stop_codon:yes gene_type:complete